MSSFKTSGGSQIINPSASITSFTRTGDTTATMVVTVGFSISNNANVEECIYYKISSPGLTFTCTDGQLANQKYGTFNYPGYVYPGLITGTNYDKGSNTDTNDFGYRILNYAEYDSELTCDFTFEISGVSMGETSPIITFDFCTVSGKYNSTYTIISTKTDAADGIITVTAPTLAAVKHTITFNANGGTTPSQTSEQLDHGSTYGDLPTTSRIGYDFSGWYTAASDGTQIYSTSTVDASRTLYAQWTAITYQIKYNSNGATNGSMSNSTHTYDSAKNLTANTYERIYTVTYNYNGNGSGDTSNTAAAAFNGWAKTATGSKAYADRESVINLRTTSGTYNLYANWTLASVTLPNPTRIGYKFSGWYDKALDGTNIGAGGAKYTPTDNVTLYAQWTPINYEVKYDGNGNTSSGLMENSQHTYDIEKNLSLNTYEKGYVVTFNYNITGIESNNITAWATFTGWKDNNDNIYTNGQSVKNLTTTDGDIITLIAQWVPGTLMLETPTRSGYEFNGWYDAASEGIKIGDGGTSYTPTNDVTLYAQWTPMAIVHVKPDRAF